MLMRTPPALCTSVAKVLFNPESTLQSIGSSSCKSFMVLPAETRSAVPVQKSESNDQTDSPIAPLSKFPVISTKLYLEGRPRHDHQHGNEVISTKSYEGR